MLENKTFTIQEIINESVKKEDRAYEQKSWHASALGSCLTGAYLIRKGIAKKEFDDRTLRVFGAGRMFEDWLIDLLAQKDEKFETQVRCEWPEMDLTGYADLTINGLVYEIKSKHSKSFWYMEKQGGGPNRHHEYQLWTYLKCLNKKEGRLLYISKDDLSILEYPVFLEDKKLAGEVMSELEILNRAWKEQLPPPPIQDKKDWRFKWCSIHQLCLNQPAYLSTNHEGNL
jgi:hypothetical protein